MYSLVKILKNYYLKAADNPLSKRHPPQKKTQTNKQTPQYYYYESVNRI